MKLYDLNHDAPLQVELWSSMIELCRAFLIFFGFLWHSMQLSEIETKINCAKISSRDFPFLAFVFKLYLYCLPFV